MNSLKPVSLLDLIAPILCFVGVGIVMYIFYGVWTYSEELEAPVTIENCSDVTPYLNSINYTVKYDSEKFICYAIKNESTLYTDDILVYKKYNDMIRVIRHSNEYKQQNSALMELSGALSNPKLITLP